MVPKEILQNVFQLQYSAQTATGFRIAVNGDNFIVTAKHLFPKTITHKSEVQFEVSKHGKWVSLTATYLVHTIDEIDIAVLRLKTKELKESTFEIGSNGFYLSQECFFLGFPYGMKMEDKAAIFNDGFPAPFVKRGIVSSYTPGPTDVMVIYVDGLNNPGFSGGPLVVRIGTDRMQFIGVVSSYLNEKKKVKTPIGEFDTEHNTGIVVTYASDHVLQIIEGK
ncbi:MAG TPA: serine protease [Cyclobacteriaceae bacterium]|nr:serine protease [Cyclobacteriaceae bacterium]